MKEKTEFEIDWTLPTAADFEPKPAPTLMEQIRKTICEINCLLEEYRPERFMKKESIRKGDDFLNDLRDIAYNPKRRQKVERISKQKLPNIESCYMPTMADIKENEPTAEDPKVSCHERSKHVSIFAPVPMDYKKIVEKARLLESLRNNGGIPAGPKAFKYPKTEAFFNSLYGVMHLMFDCVGIDMYMKPEDAKIMFRALDIAESYRNEPKELRNIDRRRKLNEDLIWAKTVTGRKRKC